MKSVYKSMRVTDSNITNPAQVDRVKETLEKPKDLPYKKESEAISKEEYKPKFKQNSPDYTPAKRPKPTVIVKQKKRTFPSK